MTIADMNALAYRIIPRDEESPEAYDLARAILDLLAEDAPCGFEIPRTNGGYVHLPSSWDGSVTPDDARALARLLLRSADEADAKGKP